MKIAACLICKGDEELLSLQKAVASCVQYVDGVYITCNGTKTDETKAWCETQGYHYSFLAWDDDFARQRNFNFAQVPKDTDYVFWMDSDDLLVGGDHLRQVAQIAMAQNLDCVLLTYWYSCLFDGEPSEKTLTSIEIQHERERLINPKKIIWKGRLHETPLEITGTSYRHSPYPYHPQDRPLAILHTHASRLEDPVISQGRNDRNQHILELQLDEERKKKKPDPRTMLYLMKIYIESDNETNHRKCLDLGSEYLELSGWDQERGVCLVMMGRAAAYLHDFQTANRFYHAAIQEYPFDVSANLRVAESYLDLHQYDKAHHWYEQSLKIEEKLRTAGINNIISNKILATQIGMRLYWEWDQNKNFEKAYKLSQLLYELEPHQINADNMELLRNLTNLNSACRQTDKLCQYLMAENEEKAVFDLLQSLPQSITSQPFAINYYKRVMEPRIWGPKEICYFANFGQCHVEQWDGTSLAKGIGGSETAVIQLAEAWTQLGYHVVVYGDPPTATTVNGVEYRPYYFFNIRDKFNIFIQWRNGGLANLISAKKFYVDLHDITNVAEYLDKVEAIDGIFVKSQAHKRLLKGFPDDKLIVISNGIGEVHHDDRSS